MLEGRHTIERFDNIRAALDFTVENLVAARHGYVISVLGSEQAKAGRAATLQVVAQDMITGDGEPGLSVHLPFDAQSGQFDALVRFLDTELATRISECIWRGIPCFYAKFGSEAERADRAILQVLVQVFGYSPAAEFPCEVYDEGPLLTAPRHRAPPGGWGVAERGD
jgi:hypothetical protein